MKRAWMLLWAVAMLAVPLAAQAGWEQLPGQAMDIGVGGSDNAWCIGTNRTDGGGYGVWRWDGRGWQAAGGAGVRIASDDRGGAWIVNSENRIWHNSGGRWQKVGGQATDIGCGGGQVWAIGGGRRGDGGNDIWRYLGGDKWQKVDGQAVRIAVDDQGNPWVVSANGAIYRWTGGGWQHVPGQARDIGCGGGQVWVIGAGRASGGYEVFRWNGSGWDKVGGSGTSIAVDSLGRAWICNYEGRIYRWR